MDGIAARAPTLMKICGAVSSSSPTRTSCGDSKLACPWYTVQFGVLLSKDSNAVLDFPVISSLRAFTRFISVDIGPANWIPNSPARRLMCAAYADATSVLVGIQPVLTHVPPKRPRSIMATRWSEAAIPTARNGPDCPIPMTIASKLFFMIGDHPRFAPLKVDLDVSSRSRAANQHVSFGGRLKRLGQIVDRTADQRTFAGMTHPRSAGPPHWHIARLREFQQTVPIRTPRHCQSTSSKRNLRPRTGRPFRLMRRPRLSIVDPRVYGLAGAEDFRKHSAG